jgi:adenine-specific DNA-methyltransferase
MNEQGVRQAIEAELKTFPNQPLAEAATKLLGVLGYNSTKRLKLKPNTLANFVSTFSQGRALNDRYALPDKWKTIDFLFQLTDDEIRVASNQQLSFESKSVVDGAIINSYLFFALELKGGHYSRAALAGITREVNKLFNMPALILFRHGDELTLAIINRRLHKREEDKDVLEKVTLIQDIRCVNPHRAHIEILLDLSLDLLHEKHGFTNFVELHASWQKTLDTTALNKRFYQDLANWYFWALPQTRFPKHAPKDADGRDSLSLIRLITRVIFCWFLKEKGLLSDVLFEPDKTPALLNDCSPKESTYYKAILQNLFFATLNQEMNKREFRKDGQHFMAHNLYRYRSLLKNPSDILKLLANIPFMNGGLFECLDRARGTKEKPDHLRIDGFSDRDDNSLKIPNDLFFSPERVVDLSNAYGDNRFKSSKVEGLIRVLGRYKFTVAENTPIEEEVALDPELLGKVFENLLAAYNPETGATARKQTGSFYTPREIVNYMVDESLIASLKAELEVACPKTADTERHLHHLFAYNDQLHNFTPTEVDALIEAIDHLKILDPACGSGAFPMGVLHKLVFVLGKLDPGNQRWKDRQLSKAAEIPDATVRERVLADIEQTFGTNELDYGRKLFLIENCIYGVDIQPIAVQISKLRFFISLVVDQKMNPNVDNFGIRPLPNLETRFVAANTLVGIERPGQQLLRNPDIDAKENELRRVRERHFLARTPATKAKCREQDATLRGEIAELLKSDGWDTTTARRLASWDPYDQNATAEFMDAEWMFGVVEGFDIITGNPPYIEFKKLEQKYKDIFEPLYASATGKYDIYVLFIEHALRWLRPNGLLAFINPTTFLKKDFGTAVRRLIKSEFAIQKILDFADFQVFDGATNYTGIFLFQKKKMAGYKFQYHKYKRLTRATDAMTFAASLQIVDSGELKDVILVDSGKLSDAPWDFHTGGTAAILSKMDCAGTSLGELAESIFQGIASGKDEVFYVDSDTIAEWSLEKAALIPLLKGQDVKRYALRWSGNYVIYLYNDASKVIPEKELKREFPNTFAYLYANRSLLSGRPYLDNSTKQWYELWNQRKRHNFERLRIVTPEISERNNFALVKEHAGNTKTYHIILNDKDEAKYYSILSLLNSRLLQFYYCAITAPMAGGFYAYKTQFLERLPVKMGDKSTMKELATLARQILALKRKNPSADTAALEGEIDRLVYSLYDITAEEVRVVEESTRLPQPFHGTHTERPITQPGQ